MLCINKLLKWDLIPFFFLRIGGRYIGSYFIGRVVLRDLKASNYEYKLLKKYFHQILLRKGTSGNIFQTMFPNFMFSDKSIMSNLHHYSHLDISFYYGDEDWADSGFNGRKVSEQLIQKGHRVYVVSNSGHHMYNDNAEETIECLLDDFAKSGM